MARCIIHVDGSSCTNPVKRNGVVLGWGVLAEHDNTMHETFGACRVSRVSIGAHEDLALLQALHYMRRNGFSPEDTSVYCDDDLFAYAPTYLAKENFLVHKADKIVTRIAHACELMQQEALVPQILNELQRVNIHKIKGHQGHVYQERVDYLAKWSARKMMGDKTEQLPFEAWLKKGLVIYMPPEKTAPRDASVLGEAPSLADLGLAEPDTTPEASVPYKPRVRIQYAPFVHTLLASEEELVLASSPSP